MPFFMSRAFWLPLTTRTCNHSTDRLVTLPDFYYLQGAYLSQFLRKLFEFDVHFMHLQIFDKTPDFCQHLTFFRLRTTPKLIKWHRQKSQHTVCVVRSGHLASTNVFLVFSFLSPYFEYDFHDKYIDNLHENVRCRSLLNYLKASETEEMVH